MTKKIIEIACQITGVTKEEIMTQDRSRAIADARKLAMLLCRDYTLLTYWELGVCFERDHTTIIHACEIANDLIFTDPAFKKMFLRAKCEVETLGLTKVEIKRKKGFKGFITNKAA